jgi:hypothetical protein
LGPQFHQSQPVAITHALYLATVQLHVGAGGLKANSVTGTQQIKLLQFSYPVLVQAAQQ